MDNPQNDSRSANHRFPPEAFLELALEAMPEMRELVESMPGGAEMALHIVREMPCLCGSGKPAFECHLRETDSESAPPVLEDDSLVEEEAVQVLPQSSDVWEMADLDTGAYTLDEDGVPQPTHTPAVADAETGALLGMSILLAVPAADTFSRLILKTCAHPHLGNPRRPAVICVDDAGLMAELTPLSARLGVELELAEELPAIRDAQQGMLEFDELHGHGAPPPGLLETPGVTEPAVASAFRAAASFYRKAPWRRLDGELPIEIETDLAKDGSCVAIVMGQAGECEGLALYDTRRDLERFASAVESDGHQGGIESASCLSVFYLDLEGLPPEDHRALLLHDWSVAGKLACPFFLRMDPGDERRRPLPQELELLEAALRALPRFLDKHAERGRVPQAVTEAMKVKTVGGTKTVTLSCRPEDVL